MRLFLSVALEDIEQIIFWNMIALMRWKVHLYWPIALLINQKVLSNKKKRTENVLKLKNKYLISEYNNKTHDVSRKKIKITWKSRGIRNVFELLYCSKLRPLRGCQSASPLYSTVIKKARITFSFLCSLKFYLSRYSLLRKLTETLDKI